MSTYSKLKTGDLPAAEWARLGAEAVQAVGAQVRADGAPHSAHEGIPPINNMGVTKIAQSMPVTLVMTDSGQVKEVMLRAPAEGQCAIVDWCNFTVHEETWRKTGREHYISDDKYVREASRQLEKILGFGVTEHRNKGLNFYKDSWVLGDNFGFVCFGGQNQTMLIVINGLGCANALDGWEKRLFQFLKSSDAVRPQITRIDLAHDDLFGDYLSVDWAEQQWEKGGYTPVTGGVAPECECIGNWHRPNGKGRTFAIGRRQSGKYGRCYEKGKKEGCTESPWARFEVEFKSKDRVIPFDVLLVPSSYFVAAYPCISEFATVDTPERITTKQKTAEISIEHSIEVTKHQFGKHLRVFRDLYGDKETLDLVCNPDPNAWPKRLIPITAGINTCKPFLHKKPEKQAFDLLIPEPEVIYENDYQFWASLPSTGLNARVWE